MSAENHCRSIGTQTEEGGFRSETEDDAGSRGESGGSEKFKSEIKEGTSSLGGSRGLFKK